MSQEPELDADGDAAGSGTADLTETASEPGGDDGIDAPDSELDREELTARLDLLREENQRLRREYARARRSQYRQTALGFALVGVVALGGGLLFPESRVVLFALAGTGLFTAVLTYYLTPERLVPVSVGRAVYTTLADGVDAVAGNLGLAGERVYVPTVPGAAGEEEGEGEGEPAADATGPVRLFLPHRSSYALPSSAALDPGFVVSEDPAERGLALAPVGGTLFEEFEQAATGSVATEPGRLADQLADAIVEQFELAESVQTDITLDPGAEPGTSDGAVLVAGVEGSAYGPLDRHDHPLVSFLAVGAARSLNAPVTVTVTEGDDRFEAIVAVERYESDESGAEAEPEPDDDGGEAETAAAATGADEGDTGIADGDTVDDDGTEANGDTVP